MVVSTATLALQSQLVDHDLPRLADAVEPAAAAAADLRRAQGPPPLPVPGPAGRAPPRRSRRTRCSTTPGAGGGTKWLGEAGRLGKQIQRLRDWAEETDTGDRDELDPGVDDQAWRLVSMPARECVGATRCPFGAECFAEASRARAREADIVVTNHSLLAVDMLAGRHIVPPHKLLIVDEAHELADRVSSAAQAELTPELVDRAARRARPLVAAGGAEALAGGGRRARRSGWPRRRPGRLTDGPAAAAARGVHAARRGHPARRSTASATSRPTTPTRCASSRPRRCSTSCPRPRSGCSSEDEHDVAWVEKPEYVGGGRRALVVAPLSVAGTLATHLYDERTVVATSATLALGGRFDTVARALGLPRRRRRDAGRPRRPTDDDADAGDGLALARRRLAVRLPPAGHPLRRRAPAPARPRPACPTPAGRGAAPAGRARSAAVPSGSSPPAGPRSRPPRCCGPAPT